VGHSCCLQWWHRVLQRTTNHSLIGVCLFTCWSIRMWLADAVRVNASRTLTKEEDRNIKNNAMPRRTWLKLFFANIFNYVLFESWYGKCFPPIIWLITCYITLTDLSRETSVNKSHAMSTLTSKSMRRNTDMIVQSKLFLCCILYC